MSVTFRLTMNTDPEERLEEAVLWKAIWEASGGTAVATYGTDTSTTFGCLSTQEAEPLFDYWNDPAFLAETQRYFATVEIDQLGSIVDALHQIGHGAFIKSTRSKHAIFKVKIGQTVRDVMGEMIYSFIDGGPALMVQQLVKPYFEWRFFCVDRKIVTHSNCHPTLTPLDFPLTKAYATAGAYDTLPESTVWNAIEKLQPVAERIAKNMKHPTAVIDCAFIDSTPACIELNPLRLGQIGLFACDVRALVKAVFRSKRIPHMPLNQHLYNTLFNANEDR